ncbi:shikimate dehydrogenase [Ornithinibacillus xuwenensis]|uniref:Shikimate dehydrogenase (NADP(+)) n=1 Tax=Ornithinibacillus xuwenensis TaxID=3144668 RepID=A0ABU9XEE9_9BACI
MDYPLALIGYPIQHSLSPWIHRTFLEETDLKGNYTIEEIFPARFESEIQYLLDKGYVGFNVTLPFKQKIIPLLDELDDNAKQIGAVNTVVKRNNRLIGYNTDGIGYIRTLEQYYPEFMKNKEKHILIIGAGGAARGIYFALNQFGFQSIDITNRTTENALEIVKGKAAKTYSEVISLSKAQENLKKYDLIIQTTSVGMKPNTEQSPLQLHNLKDSVIVSDILYQPIWTNFIKDAVAQGARIHLGHTMLLNQAQYAFEIWTGKQPSIKGMDQKLKQILEG